MWKEFNFEQGRSFRRSLKKKKKGLRIQRKGENSLGFCVFSLGRERTLESHLPVFKSYIRLCGPFTSFSHIKLIYAHL